MRIASRSALSLVSVLFSITIAVAADPAPINSFTLTVEAGKYDRVNTPVRASLTLAPNADPAVKKTASLLDADGKPLPAQMTRPHLLAGNGSPAAATNDKWELYFILPSLKAGQSTTFTAGISDTRKEDPGQSATGFAWHDVPNEFSALTYGGRPVMTYMCKPLDESSPEARMRTFKVFHHVFDPEGKQLVTNGGEGGLYPHHRGMFFGFRVVTYDDGKKCDIWHCLEGAHQSHEGILAEEAGQILGRHRVAIDWHGANKEVFAKEDREVTAYNVPGGTLMSFSSLVRTTGGPVKLDGDPQHAGFHFRAHNDVADKTKDQTYFLRPDGKGLAGETRNWDPMTKMGPVNLPWDAMSFVLNDKRYTVAYLDRPGNPKEARFSERDYGRFGSYFEYDLTADKPLRTAYRVWLQEGEMTGDEVEALSHNFVEPVRVEVTPADSTH